MTDPIARAPVPEPPPPMQPAGRAARVLYLLFGWLNVGVGLVGVVVPGLPTTVFFIVAVWAFSRSSQRFQHWLWTHPTLGPPIRAWHLHRVIPTKAKMLAVVMMSASFAYVAIWVAEDWRLPTFLAAIMLPAAAYVVTRASSATDSGLTSEARSPGSRPS
ncbi:MAG: YbaN family protein [Hyphomicrobiales bacterium]|nr:YbaN family protein [Hyphomicrobiales bacterium]MCP5371617.1 YbaN family protein [Hyphomicrobiales bacterium]